MVLAILRRSNVTSLILPSKMFFCAPADDVVAALQVATQPIRSVSPYLRLDGCQLGTVIGDWLLPVQIVGKSRRSKALLA
jgi:hypothetical protein